MSANLLLDRFRWEATLIANAAEKPSPSQDIQDAILICKDLPIHARQARESLWRLLETKQVDDLQQASEVVLFALNLAIQVVAAYANHTKEPLQGVLAELEQIRQEHLDRSPWFRQEDLDQAKAEAARGETVDMDDAFAAIAGVSRAEWESKVEAFQQKKRSQEGN